MRKEKQIIIINFIYNKSKFYFIEKIFITAYLRSAVLTRTIIIITDKIMAINKNKILIKIY